MKDKEDRQYVRIVVDRSRSYGRLKQLSRQIGYFIRRFEIHCERTRVDQDDDCCKSFYIVGTSWTLTPDSQWSDGLSPGRHRGASPMEASGFYSLLMRLSRCPRCITREILEHTPALHDEDYVTDRRRILEWIAIDRDDVGL